MTDHRRAERSANPPWRSEADMNAPRQSDESIVPVKLANNDGAEPWAEPVEGRDSTERNVNQAALSRTQSRIKHKSCGLAGVREAARKDSALKFTAWMHHVNEDCLTEAFYNLKRTAGNVRLSRLHACGGQDTGAWTVPGPSVQHQQSPAGDAPQDQRTTTQAVAPTPERNGTLAAASCPRLAELSCRAFQLPAVEPFL